MVDSMKQIFLLKPEVLTPNRNGFMAKKCKWHLKAGSTVYDTNMKYIYESKYDNLKMQKDEACTYIVYTISEWGRTDVATVHR